MCASARSTYGSVCGMFLDEYTACPSSCNIVPIQYSLGTMFASTRTSPSRSMSVQKACGDLPFCSNRSAASEHVIDRQARCRRRRCAHSFGMSGLGGTARPGSALVYRWRFLEERVVVVPRHQVGDRHARASSPAARRCRAFALRERLLRDRLSRSSNSLMSSAPSCSLRASCRAWKFLKPSCVAASLRSFTNSARSASTVAPTPLLASHTFCRSARIGRLLERAAHLAVGDLQAVHRRAEHVERLLHRVRLRGDLFEQFRGNLLFQVLKVQQLHLPGGERVLQSSPLSADGLQRLSRARTPSCRRGRRRWLVLRLLLLLDRPSSLNR